MTRFVLDPLRPTMAESDDGCVNRSAPDVKRRGRGAPQMCTFAFVSEKTSLLGSCGNAVGLVSLRTRPHPQNSTRLHRDLPVSPSLLAKKPGPRFRCDTHRPDAKKITSGFGRRSINGHCVARRLTRPPTTTAPRRSDCKASARWTFTVNGLNTSMYSPSSLLVTNAPRRPRSWDRLTEKIAASCNFSVATTTRLQSRVSLTYLCVSP
jgi:hypothetical protein